MFTRQHGAMLSNVRHRALAVLALLCALAACGGGGGGGGTLPSTPQSTPTTNAPQPYTLSSISGVGSVTSGSATAYASAAVTVSASATSPIGVAVRRRATDSQTALVYFGVAASAGTAVVTEFKASITLSGTPSGPVSLSEFENGAWIGTNATVTQAASTVSFDYTLGPAAVAPVYFALYTGQPLPTPSPSPSPSTSPSTSPTTSPTASATSSATASPTASPTSSATPLVGTACLQTPDPTTTPGISNVGASFFSTIVPNGHTICLSAWDLSNAIDTALETAAHNGANVVVITPWSERSSNGPDVSAIIAAGGKAVYEYTGSLSPVSPSPSPPGNATTAYQLAPMDIHAKFALVDGRAYGDGHNWLTSPVQDVVTADGNDFAAMQTVLSNLATTPSNGTFTTDKQLSLQNESNYLQTLLTNGITTGNEYDFITESFSTVQVSGEYNDDVYDGMCAIAQTGATMHVVVEEFSGYSTAAQAALRNLELIDANASVRSDSNGHEKISMYRPSVGGTPSSAWFGSSNATSTDLFDWGLDTSDAGMLAALQSYFDSEYNTQANPIPTASPGVTPAPCSTPHP